MAPRPRVQRQLLLLSLCVLLAAHGALCAVQQPAQAKAAPAAAKTTAHKPKPKGNGSSKPKAQAKGKGKRKAPAAAKPMLFVFGDSLVDVGNNNYFPTTVRANFKPYGMSLKWANGRFSNGLLVPDFLAMLMKIPSPPPFLSRPKASPSGINFGSAGGHILNDPVVKALNFSQQVGMFKQYVKSRKIKQAAINRAIFFINFGSTDCISTYTLSLGLLRLNTVWDEQVAEYIFQLRVLIAAGARKFVISNVAPVGCTPVLAPLVNAFGACNLRANKVAVGFNRALDSNLDLLQSGLTVPGVSIVRFNTYQMTTHLFLYPEDAGVGTIGGSCCSADACGSFLKERSPDPNFEKELCKNPNDYFFFDKFHPSEAVNRFAAKAMWLGLDGLVTPISVRTLVLGQQAIRRPVATIPTTLANTQAQAAKKQAAAQAAAARKAAAGQKKVQAAGQGKATSTAQTTKTAGKV